MLRPLTHAADSCQDGEMSLGQLEATRAYLGSLARHATPGPALAEAWDCFYQTYSPLIRRFSLACGVSRTDLDDCVQEVWNEIVQRLPEFCYDPRRGRFRTWLYALVRSKAVDLIRVRTRHPTVGLPGEAELRGPDPDPAAQYECHCQQEAVRRALVVLRRRVSQQSYDVLHMYWIEGCSVPEIAAALGLTAGQVRLRHHRVKDKFRRLFGRFSSEVHAESS